MANKEVVSSVAGPLATFSTGLFAGAALFLSAVEHPAAMETDVKAFYKYFPSMYKRAAAMQVALSTVGAASAAVAAANGGHCSRVMWGSAAVLIGSMLPYTVVAMFPTNNTIKEQTCTDQEEQRKLLDRWGRLHLVRTVLSCASAALMAYTLVAVRTPPKHRG